MRERLTRIGVTTLALAATVGIVALMRIGAQSLVSGGWIGATGSYREPTPNRLPASRVYDLTRLIPEGLRLNVGGIEAREERRVMPMPLEQAKMTSENEASALGWERLDMPLAFQVATAGLHGEVYVTRAKEIVRRVHEALKAGGTLRKDFYLPAGTLLDIKTELTLEDILAMRSDGILNAMPSVIRDIQVAQPLYTQYNEHIDGASFFVNSISPWSVQEVRLQLTSRLTREGWTRVPGMLDGWQKENLLYVQTLSPREDGSGTVVATRFADDENIINRKETEDGE